MPSWNVHTAHVERLLAEEGASALGIKDENCFLFGNFVPDIYAGWMVPIRDDQKIDYKQTHWTTTYKIPKPEVHRFWAAHVRGGCSDLTVGALCHLICDRVYNAYSRDWMIEHDIELNHIARERKQADFDLFGRTLDISRVPAVTDELIAQCAAFPQYTIGAEDAQAAVESAKRIVKVNQEVCVMEDQLAYDMFIPEFFDEAFETCHICLKSTLHAYAAGI